MNRNCLIKEPARENRAEWRRSSATVEHERLAFLNEASRRIGSSLDLAETGRELVDTAVPQFADAVSVIMRNRLIVDGDLPARHLDGTTVVRRVSTAVAVENPQVWTDAFPVDEVMPFPATVPHVQCMTKVVPLMYPVLDEQTARTIAATTQYEDKVTDLLTNCSFIAVPLSARGQVLGCVSFLRMPDSEPFEEPDVAVAEELAARTAVCIDNARLYTRERRTALTLQRGLLPAGLPQALGMEITSRYLPASDLTGVGGDWYDVIALPGCRTALVVGDVMGHGTRAAATMGQLRTAARTLASLDLPPHEVLFRLNLMSQDLDPTQIATCIYAVYDPVTRTCALSRAGHVPPVLLHPDRSTEIIDLPPGLPLGIGSDPLEMRELVLPAGSTLALYTDGLVESRDRDLDAGIMALRRLLAGPVEDLEDMCDVTINSQRSGHDRDDIALLVARVRELDPDEVAFCALPADPQHVAQARRFVRSTLRSWGLASLIDSTELIVSELVTNALKHGWPPIELRLLRGRMLVCEVADGSTVVPVPRSAGADEDTGRGLRLIKQLSHRWGTRPNRNGKIIWTEQPLP